MNQPTPKEILIQARALLLTDPKRWGKLVDGYEKRTVLNAIDEVRQSHGLSGHAYGEVAALSLSASVAAGALLSNLYDIESLMKWHDASGVVLADVIDVLDRAIIAAADPPADRYAGESSGHGIN